ncbi:unnamed protein product [Phytophthora fragariaefolia]|uniref:Unnamed protein product n=1 Tax=Phytophthora fragariaefolia TaxID=1490495 RepID=A0A9W6TTI8_9STRA|nr:unnamed protein product [Phytophthora fragariaefolia]
MERSPRVRKRRPVDEGDSDTDASWGVESVESSESSDLSWRVGGSSQSEASAIGCRSSDDHSSEGNHVEISPDLEGTQFDSWEAFHSVKDRNKIIDKVTNPTATKIPEDFKDYANPFAVSSILSRPKAPWDTNRKFREANHITTSVSDVVSGLGVHEYRVAMMALARVALLFKEKQFGVIEELSSPRSRGDVPDDAVESDDVIELGTTDSTPADGIGLNEAEGTEVIDVELPLPGTMSSESDTLLGTPSVQSGTLSIQSDTLSIQLGTLPSQSGTLPSQSGTQSSKSGTQSGTVLRPETLDTATADFEISRPLRPRGRPKQKSKAKKAKRNLSIQIANDDSILHDKRLIIPEILSHKAPIAHVIAKLPASKPLLEPSDISRILTRDLLRRSDAKVTSLQKKRNGLAEKDVAVEFPGLGVITTSTLIIMKRWHKVVGALKVIKKAQTWVASIDLSMDVPPAYQVDEDAELPAKLNAIPILSEKRECGGDRSWQLGRCGRGMTTIPDETVTNMFAGVSNERLLIPMNCNGNHWRAIMVNLQTHEIRHYDPMMSSYGVSIRAVTQRLLQFMPRSERRYKVDPYVTDMGIWGYRLTATTAVSTFY